MVGAAWDRVLHADRPMVLEVIADPNVPPMPPHIQLSQVKALAGAIAGKDPDTGSIIKQGIKAKIAEITS